MTDTIITLVNALVVSGIDYCNAVLAGVHDVHLRRLQRHVNAAAKQSHVSGSAAASQL